MAGQLKAVVDKYGWRSTLTHDAYGRLIRLDLVEDGQSSRLSYAYHNTGLSSGRLATVTFEINNTPIQRARFAYFETGTAGTAGDLLHVAVEKYESLSGIWRVTQHKHYRYYTAASATGFVHGLKYAIRGAAYDRMAEAGFDPRTAPEATLAKYAG